MHYLHKLEFDGLETYIIGTRMTLQHDCKITLLEQGNEGEIIQALQAISPPCGVKYRSCKIDYAYKGNPCLTLEVGPLVGKSKFAGTSLLWRYHNWIQQWPEGLFCAVDGKPVSRPRIIRREFIPQGDTRYFDWFVVEDLIFDNFDDADKIYRMGGDDNEFEEAVRMTGEWPMYCGAIRDGVETGDVSKEAKPFGGFE